ncbi:MAG: AAA family ATPase [Chloroflexi bacterium]|nr:AAA family ATPase [Chloroflexota bacterium]
MTTPKALSPDQLRPFCDPAQFMFRSTAELEDLSDIIGQARAIRALEFGMGMRAAGYNIYVLGPAGTGKTTAVQRFIERDAAKAQPADDWVYVYNFQEPGRPNAMRLPAGRGRVLRDDINALLKELQRAIPEAFESEDYITQRDKIINALNEEQQKLFEQLTTLVEKYNFSLVRLPNGFMLVPTVGGKPLTDQQFEQLTEEQKEKLLKLRAFLQEEVDKTLAVMRRRQQQARQEMAQLDERVARFTISHPIDELKARYQDTEEVIQHLEAMTEDLVKNVDVFKSGEQPRQGPTMPHISPIEGLLRRYSINLLVDNGETEGAPVIMESNPNFTNLVGRIEHQVVMGALVTDFTMIRPGALHRANGGYLVLDALALLQRPQAWDALKRALKEKVIRIEEYAQSLGLISTAVLEPEPIPLQAKVVLTGPPWLYYLLQFFDEDFDEQFKVQADFDDRMPRDQAHIQGYAQFIATICRQENLPHFAPDGVARIIDHSSRLVSDQDYLSTHFRDIADLITEAAYWSKQNGRDLVTAEDVQQAIDEKRHRANRIEQRVREEIARGAILVSVSGKRVGQVNGLSVLPLGASTFAKPTRITARTFMGRGGVIDIEREVKLGGPIHSKGVMILAAFLGARYAQEKPLSLHATLVFEQSYSGVEGDSASLAELCVLISSISGIPLRQDLAITGSVNQHGDVQAIGGVNEKVEGFFDACLALGELTGTQGVILPEANVKNLALREDVVQAVAEGRFHLYSVRHVDEALTLLMGLEVGEPDESGAYPPETVNGRVMAALETMHQHWRALREELEEGEDDAAKGGAENRAT